MNARGFSIGKYIVTDVSKKNQNNGPRLYWMKEVVVLRARKKIVGGSPPPAAPNNQSNQEVLTGEAHPLRNLQLEAKPHSSSHPNPKMMPR